MPTALYSPSYGDPGKTQAHRTFQTIQGLGGRLGVAIQSPLGEARNPPSPTRFWPAAAKWC
jgi:hypothetical protein